MAVDKNVETPAAAPKAPQEYQLTGKSKEVVATINHSLEHSGKTDDDVIRSLAFVKDAQLLKLQLQLLTGKQVSQK